MLQNKKTYRVGFEIWERVIRCMKCGATLLVSQYPDKTTGENYMYCSGYKSGCKEKVFTKNLGTYTKKTETFIKDDINEANWEV